MKVSVLEKFYVENNMDVLTPVDISKALGWTTLQVQKYIKFLREKGKQEREAYVAEKETATAPSIASPVREIKVGNNFAKRPERGVIAMTPAESMVGDEFHDSKSGVDPFIGMKDCIHRPKGNNK